MGWYQFNKSHKYGGASEWRALKTNSKILNSMRLFIGSQCRSRRTGVMCSRTGVLFITRAAAFCASCSRCIDFIGRPIHTLLQSSNLEITTDCVNVLTALSVRY